MNEMIRNVRRYVCILACLLPLNAADSLARDGVLERARENGRLANEGFRRCVRYVDGWLGHADPETGLIPRNLDRNRDIWNAQDSAADNYPFMVLTASITDRALFEGRMREMLETERRLTSRIGRMPDTYSFDRDGFADDEPDIGRIIFGTSEYIKDGLLPLTEWLGESPWSERMIGMLDDMWAHAPVKTEFGDIVSTSQEVNGEMLQTLSRVFFMTGDRKYLEWAVRLGDYYLLGNHHPTRDEQRLRLRDHGCEIVSGLCELYAALHYSGDGRKLMYREPVHDMLDRILEVGRNEHGLFYNAINPQTGEIVREGVADTWGYTLNGFYTVWLVDRTEAYRTAVLAALESIDAHYRNFDWEHGSADGYADAIESAINLYNRERIDSAAAWIDSEIGVMWDMQRGDGIVEGWHGDGNFARTTVMYCLWKTRGLTLRPWRGDVSVGAVGTGDALDIVISAVKEWEGTLVFDTPRHSTNMNLPADWPRINQFPEWFTVRPDRTYEMRNVADGSIETRSGAELAEGVPVRLSPGEELHLRIE